MILTTDFLMYWVAGAIVISLFPTSEVVILAILALLGYIPFSPERFRKASHRMGVIWGLTSFFVIETFFLMNFPNMTASEFVMRMLISMSVGVFVGFGGLFATSRIQRLLTD